MSLGLSGAVLLAVAPLVGPLRADAAVRMVAAEPSPIPSSIPGCDADPAGPCDEEPTPVVTVTTTLPEEPPATSPVPQKTVTTTITVPGTTPPATTAPPATNLPVEPPPTAAPVVPPPANTPPPSEEPEVEFPPSSEEPTIPAVTPPPSDTPTAAVETAPPTSELYEIRNAGSEFDGAGLSRQLGIPALILVLMVLFAVLIFEGRLRRLTHAAAIRRAGPRGLSRDPMGYPAGPGYGSAPGYPHGAYQGGTAYAPIISFVPMQMYAPVYPEGYSPEQYDQSYAQTPEQYQQQYGQVPEQYQQYGQQTAHMPAPGHEQTARGPEGHDAPPSASPDQGVPPYGGPGLQGDRFLREPREIQGAPFPHEPGEFPGAPEPVWPGDERPSDRLPDDLPGSEPQGGRPSQRSGEPSAFDAAPQGDRSPQGPTGQDGPGQEPFAGPKPPADPTGTAVYPLPGQDVDKKKRGLFRRSK
ncbi:hypothetical protein [Streptosporangium lutulentum]|uniref:Uncharacterized protein n=1 Tax=Streptosporangium lutulentum TaxID=1461250 RepID=A0ABT9QQI7_9ACTN|nr:hypothetical protein [Streptosporangium lutulentum]MDP9849029.1 hypothetical protein [Streptosporangium lutulentum]